MNRRGISAREAAVAGRFVVSVLLAAAIALALWVAYPNELRTSTDIVGYPIFANFNIQGYEVAYFLLVLVFPILSIAFYYLLARRSAGTSGAGSPLLPAREPADPAPAVPAEGGGLARAVARTAFVGAAWAIVAGIAFGRDVEWLPVIFMPVTVLYVAALVLVARGAAARRSTELGPMLARVNAIAGSFLLVGVVVASRTVQVTILETGHVDRYQFLPALPALLLALAVGALATRAILRSDVASWLAAERRVLLLLVGPLALFLLVAQLPGALSSLDLFHDGELLTGGNLVAGGRFPWRDILSVHGVFPDMLYPLAVMRPIQDSAWGLAAGNVLLGIPAYWIANYFLCAYLFRRNLLFLVGSQLLVVLGWPLGTYTRFVFLPVVLLLLAALLQRSTWPRAAGFMVAGLAQAILVPETAPYSFATWCVVVAFELVHRRPGSPLRAGFSRTIRCAAAGVIAVAAFAVFLAANDALGGFVDWYAYLVGGHDLTGGFPLHSKPAIDFHFWVYAPLATILAGWWFAAARVGSRRWFTTRDWVVSASVLALLAYYTKFVVRADVGHLFEVITPALVPLLYIVYRLVETAEARIRARRYLRSVQHPVTAVLVAIVILLAPTSPWTLARELPDRLTPSAKTEPRVARLGYYDNTDPLGTTLVPDVNAIVAAYAGPDGRVFDFTDSPALFGYLAKSTVATRYYHDVTAIPGKAQQDLVAELEQERPKLIAYSTSGRYGMPVWDGISNPVRHYLVSDYLLNHYRPAIEAYGYVFMARDDLPAEPPRSLLRRLSDSPSTAGLYFAGESCDWGHAPEFLDVDRPPANSATDLRVRPAGPTVDVRGWAIDAKLRPAQEVLAVIGSRVVATLPIDEDRADVVLQTGAATALRSGFSATGWVPRARPASVDELRFFALTSDGIATEVGGASEGARAPAELRRQTGQRIPVRSGAARGALDSLSIKKQGNFRVEVPANAASFNWLEIDRPEELGDDNYMVSDGKIGGMRTITFATIAGRSRSVRVLVGACPQWHGYRGRSLTLNVDPPSAPPRAGLLK